MKLIFTLLLCGLLNQAFAAGRDSGGGTPFVSSGNMIQAVFQDQNIWQKVSGHVNQIAVNSLSTGGTQFQVQTTESVAVKNANGVVIGENLVPCSFLVTVTDDGVTVQVTNVDFSACPTANSGN